MELPSDDEAGPDMFFNTGAMVMVHKAPSHQHWRHLLKGRLLESWLCFEEVHPYPLLPFPVIWLRTAEQLDSYKCCQRLCVSASHGSLEGGFVEQVGHNLCQVLVVGVCLKAIREKMNTFNNEECNHYILGLLGKLDKDELVLALACDSCESNPQALI